MPSTLTAQPIVRSARADDASAIAELLREVYLPYTDRFAPAALREDASTIAAAAESWLVAEVEGRPIGCVRHEREDGDHDYTFCFLGVLPAWRRMGIASGLMDSVVRIAVADGRERMLIAIRLALTENVRFFQNRGFSLIGPFDSPEHGLFARLLERQP